jgi:hypothetical protein
MLYIEICTALNQRKQQDQIGKVQETKTTGDILTAVHPRLLLDEPTSIDQRNAYPSFLLNVLHRTF